MSHYLVGTGKLSLREVFEAARFKLYKKLVVCDDTSGTRLTVLHVRVQLDSALDDFHLKLKSLSHISEKINKNLTINKFNNKKVNERERARRLQMRGP